MTITEKTFSNMKPQIGNIAEVIIVLTLGFGVFIYSSTIAFIENSKLQTAQTYNNYDFIFIIVYEIFTLAIIACYLKYRHWTYKDFNLNFTIDMIVVAVILVTIRETTGFFTIQILDSLNLLNPKIFNEPTISFQLNLVSILLISIINSIYEEVLLIGYIFKRFEKYNPLIIISISLILRASYHTYQGLANLPMILILAVVFGIYYTKYKKLWPLIIAHGIGNVFHLLNANSH